MMTTLESIRHRFASYDTLMQLTPFSVFNVFRWLLVSVIVYGCYCYGSGISGTNFFGGSTYLAQALRSIFDIKIFAEPGINALFVGALLLYGLDFYIELVSIWKI